MKFQGLHQQSTEHANHFGKKINSQSGISIIEVLIAALIASFAITAGLNTFINTNKNHIIQDGVVHMQQNGRATVDELVDKVRSAGYKIPMGVKGLYSWNADPDTIAIVYLREPACTATVSDDMPQPSAELKCTGSDLACFESDTWAYIWDPFAQEGEYFFITHVQVQGGHMQHNSGSLSKKYPAGSQIYVLDFFKYYVDNTTDPLHPTFMKEANGEAAVIYADDIVDMQLSYRMANGSVSDTIGLDRFVREVQMTVVARTPKSDLFLNDFRYDSLTTSVMVRNYDL